MRYEALAMDTAWRRFETSRGNSQSIVEQRMRALELACPVLNLAAESVHLAAEIAALQPDLDTEDRIALIVLVLISLAALHEGSTQYPVLGPLSKLPMQRLANTLCGGFGPGSVALVIKRIDTLITQRRAPAVIGYQATDYKPLLFLAPYIIHHRINHAEREVAARLAAMLESSMPAQFDAVRVQSAVDGVLALPIAVKGVAISLSAEQRRAVAAVPGARLTIISGGPGTGKTSIVLAILRLMIHLGIPPTQIALAAPTGKAAYRMGESIRGALGMLSRRDPIDQVIVDAHLEPATIHRLLGYSPESNRRSRRVPFFEILSNLSAALQPSLPTRQFA